MTQTCELTTRPTPARRRSSAPLPVLISIPNLAVAGPRSPRTRARRRRLRREVRVAGYALLALFPLSMAFVTLGSDKLPQLSARQVIEQRTVSTETSTLQAPITLAPLEPVAIVQRERDTPVFLPGYLLPADAAEESSDGGH